MAHKTKFLLALGSNKITDTILHRAEAKKVLALEFKFRMN